MNYHNAIHIPIEPLTRRGVNLLEYNKAMNGGKYFRAFLDSAIHINPEVIKLLDQYNLFIRFVELFYTPANRNTLIHVESKPDEYMIPDNMAKINFIGGGEDSAMNWYKPIITKSYQETSLNKFISYQPDEVVLVSSATLLNYNIVQTGIPHNITTKSKERYCVSLTLSFKGQTPKMIPYERLANTLNDLLGS